MIKKLSHVGVAVKDLKSAAGIYAKLFQTEHVETEEVPGQRVKVAFFRVGEISVELTEATAPDSPVAKFIEARGEGVHHLSFVVDDVKSELTRLKEAGVRLIDEEPRPGAGGYLIAFLHPKSTNGVLIELCQKMNR